VTFEEVDILSHVVIHVWIGQTAGTLKDMRDVITSNERVLSWSSGNRTEDPNRIILRETQSIGSSKDS
jgi:hypothetical protein